MNNRTKPRAILAVLGLLTVALVGTAFLTAPLTTAHAQSPAVTLDSDYLGTTLTASDTSIAASATEASTTSAVELIPGKGIGFYVTFKLAGAGTENMVFRFDVSHDGTTWTTGHPFSSGNIAATGATSVVAYFEFTPDTSPPLSHARYIRLGNVTNGNGSFALTVEEVRYAIGIR